MLRYSIGDPVTPNVTIMKGEIATVERVCEDHRQQYDIRFSNGEVWMYAEHELDPA